MKKITLLMAFVVVLAHHLKSLQAVSAQQIKPAVDTERVTTQNVDEIKKLTRVLKHQYKLHCELCKVGKNPKFMRQTPGEYEYRFNRSRNNIEQTIQKISTAYAQLGVPADKIAEQEKQLRDGIYNWV
jgi:methyl-accepting chemotaxis protein